MYQDSGEQLRIDQGAIIESQLFVGWYAESAGIVLTPRCDVEQEKAEFALLCAVALPLAVLRRQKWEPTSSDAGNQLRLILEWNHPRWHWLAPHPPQFADGAIVDFQAVTSIPFPEAATSRVIAQLDSPYREHLAARYAAYMGRIGVEELEDKVARTARRNALLMAYRELQPQEDSR